ncbi:protein DD3-3-like [Sycon ciliatum]|uniref:protein DD3-3-like n=1 Tax=Sycon ciliatum TaxID=27933 RepID=UPI0031F67328
MMVRLFDSQNNNRGGYNVGGTYYYEGSDVHFEWTNQHSCGNENNHCELIIQYHCDSTIRDGSTTGTIPHNPGLCQDYNCVTDLKYGMHENFDYYQNCRHRERNMGLFIADRNLRGTTARFTRQNNNGNRHAYECPEERDYYPYWEPTPWKDIVIMTNDTRRCPYYQQESQNVKSRFSCIVPSPYFQYNRECRGGNRYIIPITREECEAVTWNFERDASRTKCINAITVDPTRDNTTQILSGVWAEYPSHDIAAPDCFESPWSRDNHLGNGIGGFPNTYNWTMPNLEHEFCVFRMRYNISTSEYDAWSPGRNWTELNSARPNRPTNVPVWEQVGLNETLGRARGYEFEQNPVVDIFGTPNLPLRLAINTNQFGRTFQDRSHTFASRPRPEDLEDAVIHNVQVRGKRGNIVQVYPGVEYDFAPNRLQLATNDYIHFQWTGSNTNPNNNDGQGRRGTDRHNAVMLHEPRYPERPAQDPLLREQVFGKWGLSYPQHLDNTTFLGLSREDTDSLALLTSTQFRGEMSELDDAGTYFDLGPKKVTSVGTYHYMCTRNNNFSNRSQKGKLVVSAQSVQYRSIGLNGGNLTMPSRSTMVHVPRGAFGQLHNLRVESWPTRDCQQLLESLGSSILSDGTTASDCLALYPEGRLTVNGAKMRLSMSLKENQAASSIRVYQTTASSASSWSEVTVTSVENNIVTFESQQGGLYVAKEDPNFIVIGSIVAACLIAVIILVGALVYFKRYPGKISSMRRSIGRNYTYLRRSMQSRV